MPHAYAVNISGRESPTMLEKAEHYRIVDNKLTFYTDNNSNRGDEVAFFNWSNVDQVTPLNEEEAEVVWEEL